MNIGELSEAGKKGGNALKHKWTDEERDIVRRDYRGTTKSAELIAVRLGVTCNAVKGQIQKLGIAMDKSPPWTQKELDQLKNLIHRYSPIGVAKRLHRSENAVRVKAKRLKLNVRGRDDWFTKREVAEICGVDHRKVQVWIDGGSLKASWHNGHCPQKNGGAKWHIESDDFRAFLIGYSSELLGRNTDIQQIIWIVTDYEVVRHG